MVPNNPFTIAFGIEPRLTISREEQLEDIYNSFLSDSPDNTTYIITGPRGVGKTVALSIVSNDFKKMDKWLVIDLNPELDILEQIAAKIYDEGKVRHLFLKVEFDVSFKGIGFSIKGNNPVTNISTLIKTMLEYLKKKGYKVLFTIDEVVSNKDIKVFAHEYQSYLRDKLPVYLLMTGLYQNISLLQNQKTLTFLYRAPKIYLDELNIRAIVNTYKEIFKIDDKTAIELAKLTNGYAYGYQLLGNILYRNGKHEIDSMVLNKYDELLQTHVYDKLFDKLTNREKEILLFSTSNPDNTFILNKAKLSKTMLSNYKKSLYLKGIIDKDYSKRIKYSLPRFKEYLLFIKELNS